MKHTCHFSKKLFVLALLLLFSISFYGQETKTTFNPYWSLKGNFVTGFTQSDISVENVFENLGFGGNISVGYEFSPFLGFNFKFGLGSLKGERDNYTMHSPVYYDHDNISFDANYLEFTLNFESNLSNLIDGYKDRRFSFIGIAGVGRTQYRTTLYRNGTELYTFGFKDSEPGRQDNGFGNRKVSMVFTFGIGLSIRASETVDINLNWLTHYTGSDYLDGIALGETKDAYSNIEFGITYKFIKK